MKASSDLQTRLTLSATDAGDVLLAETLETSAMETGHWTTEDMSVASRDARELAGKSAKPTDFLAIRSRLTLARLKTLMPDQETLQPVVFHTWPLVIALILSAYLGGALTDRFATDGAKINLLSPPILLLLVWNLAVYLGLFLNLLGFRPSWLNLPTTELSKAFSKLQRFSLPPDSLKARFFSRWIACQDAYLRTEAARAFHLASVAFVIGLLTSIGVRGIGTAYTVGWESTWLGNHPEWISVILRSLYDLVPLDRLGGAAWPDLSVIADLRFDRVSPEHVLSASDWLLRLMLTLSSVILIPRLILSLIAGWKLSRLKKSVTLDVSTSYYRQILRNPTLPDTYSVLFVDHTADPLSLPEEWRTLQDRLQFRSLMPVSAWEGTTEEQLSGLPSAGCYDCLIGLDPTGTPEEEVHGQLLETLKHFCRTHDSPLPVVFLNLTPLIRRHGQTADNVGSRRALWESFVHEHGLPVIASHLGDSQTMTELPNRLSSLRASDGITRSVHSVS